MSGSEFLGQEQIHMGNGSGLVIKHVGNSMFQSPFQSKTLYLNNLLHVPAITKNLLSVSQFSRDNNVFFEFHSNTYFVKDQVTKLTLLVGKLRNGLYVFDSTQMGSLFKLPGSSSNTFYPPTAFTSCFSASNSNCNNTHSVTNSSVPNVTSLF
ncbi:LOW QUALITY PROTEIN: hypothetical protein TorRG33x02_289700 [Trema orientale]|uniref:Retrovirus-related Pol polyprotein from transposon TNT 1-94-like beta-barrel domain-containing protein n=1 Tax=Trema orientale TaxID=63057 RepID=A0A2P5CD54_TREOI|nr:LOW QUALITY PROTEIN: hypothetical protein TorRG33x02_289700 [Trema orientale]